MIGMINIVEFSRSRLPAVASAIYLQDLPCRPRPRADSWVGFALASPHPALHIVKQSCVTTLSGNLINNYTPVCPSSYFYAVSRSRLCSGTLRHLISAATKCLHPPVCALPDVPEPIYRTCNGMTDLWMGRRLLHHCTTFLPRSLRAFARCCAALKA